MGNYTEFFYHFVWATRKRQPFITNEIEEPLHDYLRAKCKSLRVTVHAVNGMPDHVHLACTAPPAIAVSEFLQKIKGASAHFINQKAAQEHRLQACLYWQPGFGGLTYTQHELPGLIAYIDNQKQHHHEGGLLEKLERCDDGFPTDEVAE